VIGPTPGPLDAAGGTRGKAPGDPECRPDHIRCASEIPWIPTFANILVAVSAALTKFFTTIATPITPFGPSLAAFFQFFIVETAVPAGFAAISQLTQPIPTLPRFQAFTPKLAARIPEFLSQFATLTDEIVVTPTMPAAETGSGPTEIILVPSEAETATVLEPVLECPALGAQFRKPFLQFMPALPAIPHFLLQFPLEVVTVASALAVNQRRSADGGRQQQRQDESEFHFPVSLSD